MHSVDSVYPHQNLKFPEGRQSTSKANKVMSSCAQASHISLLSSDSEVLTPWQQHTGKEGARAHLLAYPSASGTLNWISPCSSEALTTGVFMAPMALYIISTINSIKLSGGTQSGSEEPALNSNDADCPRPQQDL